MDMLKTVIEQYLCHTGTRSLVGSSTVGNDCAITWDLGQVVLRRLSRYAPCPRQFDLGGIPSLWIPGVDEGERCPAVPPCLDFIDRDSRRSHRFLLHPRVLCLLTVRTPCVLTLLLWGYRLGPMGRPARMRAACGIVRIALSI